MVLHISWRETIVKTMALDQNCHSSHQQEKRSAASNIKAAKFPCRHIQNIILWFVAESGEFNSRTCLLTLISAASLLAISFSLLGFCSSSCVLRANILHGRDSSEVSSWQQSITIQTLCQAAIALIQLLLTVAKSVWGCFGSCTGFSKRSSPGEGGAWARVGGATVSGCSPHTSFRGQRWAHSPLHCVGSSLCFPSLSLGLMNRPLATVGLSVRALHQKTRQKGDKEERLY